MPVIENADLTSVSTKFEPYPEGEYVVQVVGSELNPAKTTLVFTHKIVEPAEYVNREFKDFVNMVQNDGKPNRMGSVTIKKYMEAVFGEGSAEAENPKPDTDILNGHSVRLFLTVRKYTPKGESEERETNNVKKIFAA